MKMKFKRYLLAMLAGTAFFQDAQAQSSAFTYQGRLTDGGDPASGSYDIRFTLYDSTNQPGTVVAGPVDLLATPVSNGLFTVALDFGDGVFNGADRWLEIAVRTNGVGAFTALSSRQLLTPTPYALYAGAVDGAGIAGVVPNHALPANLVRTDPGLVEMEAEFIFRGPVEFQHSGGPPFILTGSQDLVPGLNAERLGDRTAQGFWQTGGNAGTTAGLDFLGTTDNQPLEFKVHGRRALRLEPAIDDSRYSHAVNVVAGSPLNSVMPNVHGAVIGGGGGTEIDNEEGITMTDRPNSIDSQSDYSTIGGGIDNTILYNCRFGTLGGGLGNQMESNMFYGTIGGGGGNRIETASSATISGGAGNRILNDAYCSTIGGGWHNGIHAVTYYATIGGGVENSIETLATYGVVGGGSFNRILANTEYATIGGGGINVIQSGGEYATIPGGFLNSATNYAFAAGHRAKANHTGAFVWADSADTDFASTTNNQFSIRAHGGVRVDSGNGSGISLNAVNRPLITRGHDPFTSGTHQGAGRWGLFMEPHTLVAGLPAIAGKSFCVSTYNADSTIQQDLMSINQAGTVTATIFNPTSDRTAKENFADVSPAEVLEKVAALPITRWNFKQDAGTDHVGPMAQDFHAAFGLGTDDRHIATVDADGVALAAIQGLHMSLKEKDTRICELEARLAGLEELVQNLAAHADGSSTRN